MKKNLCIYGLILFFSLLIFEGINAQWTSAGGITHTSDNVGIGTSSPAASLDVNGTALFKRIGISSEIDIYPDNVKVSFANEGLSNALVGHVYSDNKFHQNAFTLTRARGTEASPIIVQENDRIGSFQGQVYHGTGGTGYVINSRLAFVSGPVNGSNIDGFFLFETMQNGTMGERMRINPNGNIGVGTSNPQSRLSVKGKIESQEIQVVANVADYVFQEDYHLMDLEMLEKYIQENGYLPGIQNQNDVENNRGMVKLGELSISLMEKVEELTLYMIDINKRLNQLEEENRNLKLLLIKDLE